MTTIKQTPLSQKKFEVDYQNILFEYFYCVKPKNESR